jgi:Txe/YoeB family toxin of Txe-Axe toxin-antitoxin module
MMLERISTLIRNAARDPFKGLQNTQCRYHC